jgi:hypothetical protein
LPADDNMVGKHLVEHDAGCDLGARYRDLLCLASYLQHRPSTATRRCRQNAGELQVTRSDGRGGRLGCRLAGKQPRAQDLVERSLQIDRRRRGWRRDGRSGREQHPCPAREDPAKKRQRKKRQRIRPARPQPP